jgi:ubiquinone/menaquinone biosynthesis C-methylase UbiE
MTRWPRLTTQQGERPYNSLYELPAIISMLPAVAGKRVLDIGCGSGQLSAWLANQGGDVFGFDASSSMVRLAEKRNIDRASFRVADLSQPLDFLAGRSFDVAVASLVMHYIRDWVDPLCEVHRVLEATAERYVRRV